ncbi:glycosyltransferase family 4 protein [Arthrobacter sp. SIMBA_036]|uniref:glycosyltransferase family 4 protein n=2 Tax=Bacillati TaxID=1783272 RepID=UPI003978C2A9
MRLAAETVSEHLTESPFVLVLLLLRKMPSRIVRPIAGFISGLRPTSGHPVFLLAAHSAGDHKGLIRRFERSFENKIKGERARNGAEVAIAAGLPEWADTFLELAANSNVARHASTTARRQWYAGEMSRAVAVLDGGSGSAAKLHNRLHAELLVFQGWRPSLPQVDMIPEPQRVLHLLTNSVPHTASGYARRAHSILTAQREAGWEPLAVTRLGYPVQVGALDAKKQDTVDGVRYMRILPSRMARTMDGRLQQQARELLEIASDFRPAVLHTTTHFVNGLVAREVAEALNIPWVYEVRGQLADTWASTRGETARSSERYKLFMNCEGDVMRSADLVVTLGEAMKRNIAAMGVPEDKILISPNAVGGAYLEEPMEPRQARLLLGLDPDGLYIGTVSSLVGYEGLDDLVTAFAYLAPRLPGLKLVVVGDGVAAPMLHDQVQRLGLADRTVFAGRVPPEKARLYHASLDVFVVPRKDMAVTRAVTPLKPVEALASRRPVVVSDLAALREIVIDGVNGRVSKPEAPEQLAEVLMELLEDESARRRLGSAGREMVLAERTWPANAAVLGRAYENLGSKYMRRIS